MLNSWRIYRDHIMYLLKIHYNHLNGPHCIDNKKYLTYYNFVSTFVLINLGPKNFDQIK